MEIPKTTKIKNAEKNGHFDKNNPEKRGILFLRSDLALQDRILKTSQKLKKMPYF